MAITHLRPIAATVLNFKQRLTPIPNDGVNLYLQISMVGEQMYFVQEFSYRKQIARQLHTQYVESISVTLKSRLRVNQGY